MFRVKQIAEDKGWTKRRLLHATHIDPARLDRWWHNIPGSSDCSELEALEALLKVADLLQVAPRDLIAEKVTEERKTQKKRPRIV